MNKYKVGDKVVLTVTGMTEMGGYPFYVLNDNNFILFKQSIEEHAEPLSTYTEPLEAKIRRQAAEITRLLAENKELKDKLDNRCDMCIERHEKEVEQARAEGQNEAWKFAKNIALSEKYGGYSNNELKEIFGSIYLNDTFNLTYIAAAAKVEAWEKVKEEIKVGDIVRLQEGSNNDLCILCKTSDEKYYNAVDKYGALYPLLEKEHFSKTGRHIDIDSFLKQIGEE